MVGPFVAVTEDDIDHFFVIGCDTSGDNAIFVEITDGGLDFIMYESSTECSGDQTHSGSIEFGECDEFGEGYAILYYASGSLLMASLMAIGAVVGMIFIA
mmetsp:Transcript_22610/g.19631  ORF Transcript_22610/g.19631 Transcript_22610/m.19631 type:complete len:100 (+) Transcript_22610:438-737(+)